MCHANFSHAVPQPRLDPASPPLAATGAYRGRPCSCAQRPWSGEANALLREKVAGGAPPGAAATAVPSNTAAVSRNADPPDSPHSIPPFAGPSAVRIGACHPGSPSRWIRALARMAARGVNLADTRRWPRYVAAPPRGAALQPRAAGRPRKHKRNSPPEHASAGRCQPQADRRSAP